MGMFSEAYANRVTKALEKVLLDGTKPENAHVLEFLGQNLFPVYMREAEEAGESHRIPMIIREKYFRFNWDGKQFLGYDRTEGHFIPK